MPEGRLLWEAEHGFFGTSARLRAHDAHGTVRLTTNSPEGHLLFEHQRIALAAALLKGLSAPGARKASAILQSHYRFPVYSLHHEELPDA